MTIEDLEKNIDTIHKKEISRFLAETLKYNENILNNFRSNFINYFPKITKIEYVNKIWRAINNAGGKDGYIDYSETLEYTHAMYDFIYESEKLTELKL